MIKIDVVGVGVGAPTITDEAKNAIADAEVIFASKRLLERVSPEIGDGKKLHAAYVSDEVLPKIDAYYANGVTRFAILVSGDVGFYSAAKKICEVAEQSFANPSIRLIAGVSTVNAFFAELKMPWQDAYLFNAHGKDMSEIDIVGAVRRNRKVFCITGGNAVLLMKALCSAGYGEIIAYVGENLGETNARIYQSTPEDLIDSEFPSMTVVLFINDEFDAGIFYGLPDVFFERMDGVPMTKSEIRAIVMSKLAIRPECICYDVGAGSGSVTAEMALSAYLGHVYAFERKLDAAELTERNCAKLHIGNVTIIRGEASESLCNITKPDVVFIGGTGGTDNLKKIISVVLDKNPSVKLVITTVTLETLHNAVAELEMQGLTPEIVQINVSVSEKTAKHHMFKARNPVMIISAGGENYVRN